MTETKKTRKLGRGLGALVGGSSDKDLFDCPLDKIEVNEKQPRKYFDEQRLKELADSIDQYGIIQPIVLKKNGARYRIIAGERRYRAAKMLGLKNIKAVLFHGEEEYQVSLIENLQREDLNPIEVAEAYAELASRYSYTQEELSKKVGKSRSEVANHLRLLNLSSVLLDFVRQGKLSMGQVRPLTVLPEERQIEMAEQILNEKLSARAVERMTRVETSKVAQSASTRFRNLERVVSDKTGLKIKISAKKGDKIGITMTLDEKRLVDLIDHLSKTSY
ncbi:ParB/RepB/Spo0J family partition protein [bacterium]|nr:ParB/RepB/Spo0J family partition protein [bacterium]